MKPSETKNSFNLIHQDVKVKTTVKEEKSWYARLNMLILAVITALGITSYFGGLYLDQTVELKKKELVDYANIHVNIPEKQSVRAKVNLLNSRYSMYKDVYGQSIDINNFYKEIKELYPAANIEKIEVRPGATDKYVELELPDNAYERLPAFLKALGSSEKYSDIKVTGVTFRTNNNVVTATVKMDIVAN